VLSVVVVVASKVTGSGIWALDSGLDLDLEPETEDRGHEAAYGAPYMSRLHEVIDWWLAEQAPNRPPGHAANRQCPLGQAPAPVPRPGAPVTPPPGVEWKEEGTKRSAALLCMLIN
jgi:hypothetical protein